MTSGEITSIIVAFITAAGAVICAWLNRAQPSRDFSGLPVEINKPLSRGTKIFLLAALVSLGLFALQILFKTRIEFTYPQDQATVERIEIVEGTILAVPEGSSVWLVIFSKVVGRYYPQSDPIIAAENGDWSAKTFIGLQEDEGKYFDLILVLADQSANPVFLDYRQKAAAEKIWPGMEYLPEGAVIYDRITVKRR